MGTRNILIVGEVAMENLMRVITLLAVAAFSIFTPAAFAQDKKPPETPNGYTGAYPPNPVGAPTAPPFTGPFPAVDSGAGLDKSVYDTTKTVKVVPLQ